MVRLNRFVSLVLFYGQLEKFYVFYGTCRKAGWAVPTN